MASNKTYITIEENKATLQQQANEQYALARDVVYRTYLNRLSDYPIIPFSEIGIANRGPMTAGLLEISRIVYDSRGNALDDLLNVFASLGNCYGATLIIKSNRQFTHLYLGVRAYSHEYSASSGTNLLKQTLDGHFPGTGISALKYSEITELLDFQEFKDQHPEWAISVAPGIPDLKTEEREHFTQGLERFIDAMQGKEYVAVILAEPVNSEQLLNVQTGYEQMSSALSVYQKLQLSMGINDSEAISNSITEGFTHTLSSSLTLSQSHSDSITSTRSTSTSHSHTSNAKGAIAGGICTVAGAAIGTMILPGFGTMVGSQIGNAVGGMASGVIGSDTDSTSTSDSTGTTQSDTCSKSEQRGTSESTSHQNTSGTTKSLGSSQTIALEQQNVSIVRLIEKIDKQLKRIDESRAFGAWNASCYILSPETETARAGAGIYIGALRGMESGSEDSAIAVWNQSSKEKRECALEYFANLAHPRLRLGESLSAQAPIITPTSLITGKELALLMNLPRKSVGGVTVLDGVGFGRERRVLGVSNDHARRDLVNSLRLGCVHHLHRDQKLEVCLDINELVYHTLITGTTGVGKSTALRSILRQLYKKKIPWCVVEPAKDEYRNELMKLSSDDNSVDCYDFSPKGRIPCWNPLAFPDGISLADHVDRVCAVLNAAFPMYASMPQLLEKAIYMAYEEIGWNLLTSTCTDSKSPFPNFFDVVKCVKVVLDQANYAGETKSNFEAALVARLESLCRGPLGVAFNSPSAESLTPEKLWQSYCVINLSHLGAAEKKAVVMGFLLIALQEWRQIHGTFDSLLHLMVFEEAHNLLRRSDVKSGDMGSAQTQSIEFFANAIAEMRSYGQGFCVVDQSASSLDPSVIKNTNTRISFRAPDESDRLVMGGSLALNEEQTNYLAVIGNFTAVVKQSDWLEPLLCKIDKPDKSLHKESTEVFSTLNTDRDIAGILFKGRGIKADIWPEKLPDNLPTKFHEQLHKLFIKGPDAYSEIIHIAPFIKQWPWAQRAVSRSVASKNTDRGVWNALIALAQADLELELQDAKDIAHVVLRVFQPMELSDIWEKELL